MRTNDKMHARMSGTRVAITVSVAALVALFGGCHRLDDLTAVDLSDPEKRHAIGMYPERQALIVEIPPSGEGLTKNQRADVWRFVERYRKESTGPLEISGPGGSGAYISASRSLREVQSIVADVGIDPRSVVLARGQGGRRNHGIGPAVELAFDRPVAVPPQCGDWATDLGENRERLPYNNFGCASQRNLALTVANARDLEQAQEETPRSSERRSATWSSYIGNAVSSDSGGGAAGTDSASDGAAAN